MEGEELGYQENQEKEALIVESLQQEIMDDEIDGSNMESFSSITFDAKRNEARRLAEIDEKHEQFIEQHGVSSVSPIPSAIFSPLKPNYFCNRGKQKHECECQDKIEEVDKKLRQLHVSAIPKKVSKEDLSKIGDDKYKIIKGKSDLYLHKRLQGFSRSIWEPFKSYIDWSSKLVATPYPKRMVGGILQQGWSLTICHYRGKGIHIKSSETHAGGPLEFATSNLKRSQPANTITSPNEVYKNVFALVEEEIAGDPITHPRGPPGSTSCSTRNNKKYSSGSPQATKVKTFTRDEGSMYGDRWILLNPNVIRDNIHGLLWRIHLDLEANAASSSDVPSLLAFLQHGRLELEKAKQLSLVVMLSMILERRPLFVIANAMDIMEVSYSHAMKSGNSLPDVPEIVASNRIVSQHPSYSHSIKGWKAPKSDARGSSKSAQVLDSRGKSTMAKALNEMVSDASMKKVVAKKTVATTKRGSIPIVVAAIVASSKTCIGVLRSHPGSHDIQMESLSVTFHGHELIVDVELELNYGRCNGLLGLNDCGKSTLFTAIGCREPPIPKQNIIGKASPHLEENNHDH
eukprot:Gb_35345 [translate_table: standard]